MQVCFLLLLIQLHVTEGCRLEGDSDVKPITAYTGGSVLLPCSCTDLHTTPETFTWKKYTHENTWVEISPESEQYKDRVQLINDHSSGNLSLLISHLTEEDGGDYMCNVTEDETRHFRLTVEGCRLNQQTVSVTGHVGQSVLLPCSCFRLQAKPHSLRWIFIKGSDGKEIFPKDLTNRYTDRVQLSNDHHPGNLSLLISHLTVEDGGDYACRINNAPDASVKLIVKDAPRRPSTSTPVIVTTSPNPKPSTSTPVIIITSPNPKPGVTTPTPVINDKTTIHTETSSEKETPTNPDPHYTTIIICTCVGFLLLLLIVGGVMCCKHR
ncbi:polymeric immunoglobulin receptor-like, partial [Clarias magur]